MFGDAGSNGERGKFDGAVVQQTNMTAVTLMALRIANMSGERVRLYWIVIQSTWTWSYSRRGLHFSLWSFTYT